MTTRTRYTLEFNQEAVRLVAVIQPNGMLVHEATFYKDLAAIERAGIKAALVPGSHPWGKASDGF